MAARKRNVTTPARSSDGITTPSNKASNACAKQMKTKSADDTLFRVMNILVILFIIAMLNPLQSTTSNHSAASNTNLHPNTTFHMNGKHTPTLIFEITSTVENDPKT
jgi:preprotein translocase subunit SecG